MGLQEDIIIDDSAIDVEILKQPELMKKYLQIMDDAKNELDRAEESLDLIRVDLDKQIRKDPDAFGVEKVTIPAVEAAIKDQKKYQKAMDVVLDLRHEYNSAKSAVRSIEVKKSALEHLVKLHAQSYFAGPSVPRDLTAENAKRQAASNEVVSFKRKKKKKKDK